MKKTYEFKASKSELAIQKGLEELGLTEEEAEIEVVSHGGLFSKAVVRITPKVQNEVSENAEEEDEQEDVFPEEIEKNEEEQEEKEETPEERERRIKLMTDMLENGKKFISEMGNLLGADITCEGKITKEEVCIFIGGNDAKTFIGHRGETLDAVQTLVGLILNKGNEERIRVAVDADFYKERRKKSLVALAKRLASQAYDQHKEISLEPMNSYERRIIHATLADSTEATTRSEGEGRERHVIISPTNGTMSYGSASNGFRKKGPTRTKSFGYSKRKF